MNFIPYVGSPIAVTLPVLVAYAQSVGWRLPLETLGTLSLAQLAISGVVEPRMMSRSLDLSAVVVLVSLTMWAGLWGVAGAVLAIPLTSVLLIVLSEFPEMRPVVILMSRDGRIDRTL